MRNWLKQIRKKNKLNQSEVGELLGISQYSYSLIESGLRQNDLKFSTAIKIADLFGISLDEIKIYEQTK